MDDTNVALSVTEDDFDERQWLRAVAHNPVFAFLNDPEENIYSLDDGKPFTDEV